MAYYRPVDTSDLQYGTRIYFRQLYDDGLEDIRQLIGLTHYVSDAIALAQNADYSTRCIIEVEDAHGSIMYTRVIDPREPKSAVHESSDESSAVPTTLAYVAKAEESTTTALSYISKALDFECQSFYRSRSVHIQVLRDVRNALEDAIENIQRVER